MDKTVIKFRENYPDFVNKDSGKALWLIYAPEWVMPKLEGLEFVNQRPKEGKSHSEMPTDKSAQG
ncbi:hypothetical protein QJS04_geneDACA004038 [Acorus gramineus]|uniref:Uncharacterized protein n=1 Tax=Acorus gramineus TaxID=55184 RepID=A0AAV9BKC2_ACOGR|nr:hypothetical protein QJS04_geneDACA004038 [Acorus gramineus]